MIKNLQRETDFAVNKTAFASFVTLRDKAIGLRHKHKNINGEPLAAPIFPYKNNHSLPFKNQSAMKTGLHTAQTAIVEMRSFLEAANPFKKNNYAVPCHQPLKLQGMEFCNSPLLHAKHQTMKISPSKTGIFTAAFVIANLFFTHQVIAQKIVTVANPPSPWQVPPGVTSIKVEVWGGGGGGGGALGSGGTTFGRGAGGGGGAYNVITWTVVPGNNYTISRGAAGTVGANVSGGAGGQTSVSGPAGTITANGGAGGARGNFGQGTPGGAGGTGGFSNGGAGAAGSSAGTAATGAFSGGGGGAAGNLTPTGAGVGGSTTTRIGGTGGAGSGGIGDRPGAAGASGFIANSAGAAPSLLLPGGGGSGGLTTSTTAVSGGAGGPGQVVITYAEPCPTITTTTTTTDITCFNQNDGTITITVTGGEGPYTYSIDNGASYPFSSPIITDRGPGTYQIRVKDVYGCTSKSVQ